jgi:hypothetical protein
MYSTFFGESSSLKNGRILARGTFKNIINMFAFQSPILSPYLHIPHVLCFRNESHTDSVIALQLRVNVIYRTSHPNSLTP